MVDGPQLGIHGVGQGLVAPDLLVSLDGDRETRWHRQVGHHQLAEAGVLAADPLFLLPVVPVVPDDQITHDSPNGGDSAE